MKLRVQYTAQLQTIAGRPEEEIELPDGSSVGQLLRHLAMHLGEGGASHLLSPHGKAPASLLVVVNGAVSSAHEAASTNLSSGDVVLLLPPISGG